jgi:hypothetical protein
MTINSSVITINNPITIGYTALPTANQLGYTVVLTSSTSKRLTSGVVTDLSSVSIPAGTWLVSFTIKNDVGASPGTVQSKAFYLSTTSVGTTPYRTFSYFTEADDAVSVNGDRDIISLTGVVSNTTATTYYVVAKVERSALDINITLSCFTYTRIG